MKKILYLAFIISETSLAQSIIIDPKVNFNTNTISSKKPRENVVSIEATADLDVSVPGNSKLKISGESYFLDSQTDIKGSTQSIEFANLNDTRWILRDFREAGTFPAPFNTNAFQIVNNNGFFGTIPFQINKSDGSVIIQKLNYPSSAAAGKVLTSDALGDASWQSPVSNWQVIGSNSARGGFNNNITDGSSNTILVGEGNNQTNGRFLYGMGWGLQLNGFSNTVLGAFNIIPTGSNTTWVATDPLFLIGNGQSNAVRSTALTILKNGNTGIGVLNPSQSLEVGQNALINGQLFANQKMGIGTTSIFGSAKLHVFSGSSGSGTNSSSFLVRIENDEDAFLTFAIPDNKKAGIQFLKPATPGFPDQFVGSIRLSETNTFDFRLGANSTRMRLTPEGDLQIGMGVSSNGCLKDGNGTILAGTCASDSRYKKNINSFNSLLIDFVKLNPVHFDWKIEEFPNKGFGNDQSYGFIAQEVEQIFPELVKTDEKGFKAVNYSKLNIMTIQAIKELKAENDELRRMLSLLSEDVKRLKQSFGAEVGTKSK